MFLLVLEERSTSRCNKSRFTVRSFDIAPQFLGVAQRTCSIPRTLVAQRLTAIFLELHIKIMGGNATGDETSRFHRRLKRKGANILALESRVLQKREEVKLDLEQQCIVK